MACYLYIDYSISSKNISQGQSIGGTVVPPATKSNHLVGHAIDFNLETPSGWCNGDCLDWESNSYAKCFTDKV